MHQQVCGLPQHVQGQNPVPPNPMLVRLASFIWGSRLYRPAWKKLLCPARSRRNYRLVVTSERNQAMTLGLGVCRDTPGCRAVIRTPATDRPATTSMLSNSSEDARHRPTDNREAQISLTFPESSLPSDSGPPQMHMLDRVGIQIRYDYSPIASRNSTVPLRGEDGRGSCHVFR